MIILTGNNLSITVSAIAEQVINNLKTANNISTIQSAVSSSALSISAQAVGKPSWPYLSAVEDIIIPIFKEVSSVDYPYKNYDTVKVEGDKDLSAFPAPNTIELSSILDNSSYSARGISTNECLLYAFTNGILNYISSAVSVSVYIGNFSETVELSSSDILASAAFDIPSEKISEPLNFAGALWSLDSKIWKSAKVILNQDTSQITIIVENENKPEHVATSTFDGTAIIGGTTIILPNITTTVRHVYPSVDSTNVTMYFKVFLIKLL